MEVRLVSSAFRLAGCCFEAELLACVTIVVAAAVALPVVVVEDGTEAPLWRFALAIGSAENDR